MKHDHNAKIIEVAKELLQSQGFFVDTLWHINDIHILCEQNDIERLSDAEAVEVFAVAKEQFDGEHGMSWPQLEKALYTYLQRKAVLLALCESESA